MTVLVLYEDIDERSELSENSEDPTILGPEPNAFHIPSLPPNTPIRLLHLTDHFPLLNYNPTESFIFRVQDPKNKCYLDLLNPGTIVPRLGPGGSVVVKVFRSPCALKTFSDFEVEEEMRKTVPENYFDYSRRKDYVSDSSGKSSTETGSGRFGDQEHIDETLKTLKETTSHYKKALQTKVTSLQTHIEEEKYAETIKATSKTLVKGMKSLWGNIKSSTETFVESAVERSSHARDAASNMSASTYAMGGSEVVGKYTIRVGKLLAEGGFSMVYLATDNTPNSPHKKLALKKMICSTREAQKDASMEIKVLQNMKHGNIITLLASRIEGVEYSLLFEFISKSAYDVIAEGIQKTRNYEFSDINSYASPMSEVEGLECVLGVSSALEYMHETMKITHRDIKPHNILLRHDGKGYMGGPTAILMDVGSIAPTTVQIKNSSDAINVEESATQKSSAPYRSPELTTVEIGSTISGKTDVWSLGCTLFAVAFGYCPFETPKEGIMKLGILNGRFFYPRSKGAEGFGDEFRGLIGGMISVDVEGRLGAAEVQEKCKGLLEKYQE